jgi:hypothetical protein
MYDLLNWPAVFHFVQNVFLDFCEGFAPFAAMSAAQIDAELGEIKST